MSVLGQLVSILLLGEIIRLICNFYLSVKNCIQRRSSWFFFFFFFFLTVSSPRRELSPTRTLMWPRHNRVKITCNTSSAFHVQRVVFHFVRRDSSAIKFEMAFILAWLYWLKPLSDEGGEETGVPGENPWWRASENRPNLYGVLLVVPTVQPRVA